MFGFNITQKRRLPIGELVEMVHEKTGARLAWFNNGDDNKTFSITFKTIPEDDTGVFHILEHSVLGGSQNYPVKEPFLYLLKSSLQTFLNAMTFPDKTMFPVSSRNDSDFMNLTRVYLDAVFKPSIYTNPNIFYQEGHHTEYRSDSDKPAYKGVVFNEMKGVVLSVDERIEMKMMSMLFPESCYRFESGGNPTAIPDLTYEQFINTHRRFYHPSNSYIWLDGEVDIDAILRLLDGYLSEYEKEDDLPEIAFQQPTEFTEEEDYYDCPPDEDEKNAYLAIGKIVASWEECKKIIAYDVLFDALTSSNESPMKRALIESGLCLDITMRINDGICQPFATLVVNNMDSSDRNEILSVIKDTARNLMSGIGTDVLLASINRNEFEFREAEEPQGLIRCINAMSAWLHGGDPMLYIDCGEIFNTLREKVATGYFENLLAEFLLDDEGMAVLSLLPSHTYGDELRAAEQARLDSELSALTDEQKSELIRLNKALDDWQAAPDTPEDIAKIPILPLSEVGENPFDYKTTHHTQNGVELLRHPARNKGINCINLWFDVSDFSRHELELLSLIDRLISQLPTADNSVLELQKKITGTLGDFGTELCPIGKNDSPEKCKVYFRVKSRFLDSNTAQALELISELLMKTDYNNPSVISRIASQEKEELKQGIIANGHRFSIRRAKSCMSAESAVNELVNGFESYCFIRELDDEKIAAYAAEMQSLAERIFCRLRLTASITSAEDMNISPLLEKLPEGEFVGNAAVNISDIGLENAELQGINIPSGVSYSGAVLAGHNDDKALWNVLSTLMTYEYLWNEVRVKGGAYGTGTSTTNIGETTFYSFRDPSPKASIETYKKSADFIKSYVASEPDITQYIISTIAKTEPLISDGEYGTTADLLWFRGIDYNELKSRRKRMLALRADDLLEAVPALENMGNCCIIGAKSEIDESAVIYEL